MNKYIRKFPLFAAIAGCITLTASAGALDQNLVAKWTFQNGSLTSEVGGITLIEGGRRGSVETGENSVTLRDHKYLVTSEISSAKLPDLQDSITIWARLKFDKFPETGEGAVLGLMARPSDGGWRDYVFSLIYMGLPDKPVNTETGEQPMRPGLSFIGRMSDDSQTGIGVTRFQPVNLGEFVNVAIVFNAPGRTVSLWVNGSLVFNKISASAQLKDFAAFALGPLTFEGNGFDVTFDEVRVYSTALDQQWIEEISTSEE